MSNQKTAIKAFDSDFKCRGMQFEIGKTYTISGKVVACKNGFHACDGNPLDVLSYYPLVQDDGKLTRFAKVDLFGEMAREKDDDKKIAAASIAVTVELTLPEFIKSAVDWMMVKVKSKKGNDSQLAASGYNSQLAASGNNSKLAASGNNSKLKVGKNGIAVASAMSCQVSGYDGAWLCLPWFNEEGECQGFTSGKVCDGGLKVNVMYRAKNGQLIEVVS